MRIELDNINNKATEKYRLLIGSNHDQASNERTMKALYNNVC